MRRDELLLPQPPPTDRPGDRWVCGRSRDQTPCSRGPSAKGVCPLADACRVQRSWHGRRKRWSLITTMLLVVVVVVSMSNRFDAAVVKPGELSTPHAQILSGTLASQRCAACHPQSATSPWEWFSSGDSGHVGVNQTDRCLECHHTTIDRPTARFAHNVPTRVRSELRTVSTGGGENSWHDWMPGPAVDQDDVQCNACHREHRGAGGDLLAISNSQCQTCHADRFGDFATSHPEWKQWPYGRGGEIAFNHASHANQHFPKTLRGSKSAQFQCADCHQRTADNELTRSTSYERACMSCHEEALRTQSAAGIELLALPTIPSESATRIGPWPESATGFFDGRLSPLADLMLRSDPETASAIRRVPEQDFSQIVPKKPNMVAAAEVVARGHRRLLAEIGGGGQQVIVDRADALGVAPSTLSSFLRPLPPQLIQQAHQRWFAQQAESELAPLNQATSGRPVQQPQFQTPASKTDTDQPLLTPAGQEHDLLTSPQSDETDLLGGGNALTEFAGGDPLGGDPLGGDPLRDRTADSDANTSSRFDADRMLPLGGWFRDDIRLAIRYRASGHADPVLKSTVELLSQLPPGDPARHRLLQSPAISACVQCHPGAVHSSGNWYSIPLIRDSGAFTKFSHRPHLNVAELADCQHCHEIGSGSADGEQRASGIVDVGDFAPLGRQACAACHTPHAAGDTCVKCHRYHVDLR